MTALLLPEQELLAQLKNQRGRGTFEAHVTIDAPDQPQRQRFETYCADRSVKCVLIELPVGVTRSQPMTATYHRGELADVLVEVAALASDLRAQGFIVTRVKLEAVATNEGVPITDDDAKAFPANNYFEFHVKLTLPHGATLDAVQALCAKHNAHLSANARKRDADGTQRFVTQRIHGCGRARAEEQFDRLYQELLAEGYTLTNILREYSIFDSNTAVDAGWISLP
jgi:hypothetical protein